MEDGYSPDAVSIQIERTGKDSFVVESTSEFIETDLDGNKEVKSADTQTLKLSLSDKKGAVREITELYQKQGIPEHIAKQMAKDVFKMAQAQSPEKIVLIEEIKENAIVLSHHNQQVEIDISDPKKVTDDISEKLDISKEEAEQVVRMANEKFSLANETVITSQFEEQTLSEMKSKFEEMLPPNDEEFYYDDIPEEYYEPSYQQSPISEETMNEILAQRRAEQEAAMREWEQAEMEKYGMEQPFTEPQQYDDVPEEPDWLKEQRSQQDQFMDFIEPPQEQMPEFEPSIPQPPPMRR